MFWMKHFLNVSKSQKPKDLHLELEIIHFFYCILSPLTTIFSWRYFGICLTKPALQRSVEEHDVVSLQNDKEQCVSV